MTIDFKKFDLKMIESSSEIKNWLIQFGSSDLLAAKSLLCNLKFISRDDYSNWLLNKLSDYNNKPYAIYAVRKFDELEEPLWNPINGDVQLRPATTQGSEDLIASIIANANRQINSNFLDHPSLCELLNQKIRDIILVDDSIGSGKRVTDYICKMTKDPTFKSWWSYGLIKMHVLSFASVLALK